jgi:serine/threonine-protein kinase
MPINQVLTKPDDPNIYLLVNGHEYRYNPERKPLGSGAMGTVYLGYDCLTNEKVAVKRVKDQFANNKQVRERAKQEASLAFRHPNLVEMLGYCEFAPDKGPIFILSKVVVGESVRAYVKNNFPDGLDKPAKVCRLMYSALDALSYIHSRGFVHRDIKPSNMMVEENGNLRLMDLGIARMNGGNKFSVVGFIGTPQYSAPEQILRGMENIKEIGPQTDIYAMGITIYELITGTNPFKSSTEAVTLSQQIKMKLPDNNVIPWAIMKVLRKATEKDTTKRYQSADEFKVALRNAVNSGRSTVDYIRKFVKL